MSAAYQNLLVERGTNFLVSIVLDDVYGDKYNLTGFTGNSQMRKSYYSANAVASFDTSIDYATSTVSLYLAANNSANIAPGRYVYDTIISDAQNNVVRVLEGIVEVSPSVTR
jgi:hypothetical protein